MPKQAEELLNYSSLARELGIARQSVRDRRLPDPDFITRSSIRETRLWRRGTLERAGVFDKSKKNARNLGVGTPVRASARG